MIDAVQAVKDAGFLYWEDLIHLFVGGSELHGAKVEGTDDVDLYGIYIEPPEKILGLDHCEHFVWSTSGKDRRNTASDIDVTLYSLRKWAGLACKGNPTALHFLFAPNQVPERDFWYGMKEDIKKCVLSKAAMKQFVGFVDAQMGRLLGTRGRGKKGQRPELEAKYGYDVKAGMHAVRLLFECIEMLNEKTITLPRPEKRMLIDIRTGHWSLEHLCQEVSKLRELVDRAAYHSELGDNPNRERLSQIVADAYLRYWGKVRAQRKTRAEQARQKQINRAAWERMKAAEKKVQDECSHLAGALAGVGSACDRTCIVWHIFEDDVEHAVGICMHCGRQWRHTDPDYEEWRKKPCMNKLSTGGIPVKSSSYPYMEGRAITEEMRAAGKTAEAFEQRQVEIVEEPPLDMTLNEFVVAELLKRHPEKAAKIIVAANKGTLRPLVAKLERIA